MVSVSRSSTDQPDGSAASGCPCAWAAVIAVTAARWLRTGHAFERPLRPVVVVTLLLASTATVTNLLGVAGAYPTLRAFHDTVNRIGEPVGWLLLATLILIVVLGRRECVERARGRYR